MFVINYSSEQNQEFSTLAGWNGVIPFRLCVLKSDTKLF